VTTLRAVIVDDEPLARRRLRRLVAAIGGAEVVGEAGDGRQAIDIVDAKQPDVLFVDVQMPELDGFAVMARLPSPPPFVVFVTAFETFAVKAFEIQATDYLLKPVSQARLADALSRVRARADHRAGGRGASARAGLQWLPVRESGQVRIVDVTRVDWIEAANNYVVVHVGREAHILREPIGALAAALDPSQFARIHRSTVVRIDRVARLEAASRGDFRVCLTTGHTVMMSRTYRSSFERAIGRKI
jgi:two-component system LytT family response regulator